MNIGLRDKVPFPADYKAFRLMRTHGRVFGIPHRIDPEAVLYQGNLFSHPAVLSAATLPDLQELIDEQDARKALPELMGQWEDYDLIRVDGTSYGIPRSAEAGDLHLADERARVGAVPASSVTELESAVQRLEQAVPVEFAGWLPIFEFSGNCGKHPQFRHTGEPPAGYRFTCSAPPPDKHSPKPGKLASLIGKASKALARVGALCRVGAAFFRPQRGVTIRGRIRVFTAMIRLIVTLLRRGCKPAAIVSFVQSRHLQSQLLMGDRKGLVFLTSMPYTFGQNPWVIEIEDPTTLFYPLIQNGNTCGLRIAESPLLPIVKTLLEADHCKAIVTHMKSTAELVPTLFNSEIIRRKVLYTPLGVKLPARWQRHDPQPPDEPIHLLFINSWCQVPENFHVRGGLDVLEAFDTLRVRYPQLRLTMRTSLPNLADHYHRIMESGWVRVVHRFLSASEMAELHADSHIFLLPAARVHIVSLLQAMSYGLAVVASDGWGVEEYLEHERNGLVVPGRYGKASWADTEAGLLRENYEYTHTADPEVVQGIIDAVSRLVEDSRLRARLGRAARADVETRYTTANWNEGLKAAFDLARGTSETLEPPAPELTPTARRVRAG